MAGASGPGLLAYVEIPKGELEGKAVEFGGWRSREEALAVIEEARKVQEQADRGGG